MEIRSGVRSQVAEELEHEGILKDLFGSSVDEQSRDAKTNRGSHLVRALDDLRPESKMDGAGMITDQGLVESK